jgi:SAM-dependent methyltransferase
MSDDDLRCKWDARYAGAAGVAPPLEVLAENAHLLPARGDALDIACGLGGSALYLAQRGLRTLAWDQSPMAVAALQRVAGELPLEAQVRDVVAMPPEPERFDVICVGHFLERDLCLRIAAALRPGGLLFYQTFSLERVDDSGPGTQRFRLEVNELLRLFAGLTVRFYRDEGTLGDIARGFRNRAQLVAQRPAAA